MQQCLSGYGAKTHSMFDVPEWGIWDIHELDKNVNAFKSCYIKSGLSEKGPVMHQIPTEPTTIEDIGKFDWL